MQFKPWYEIYEENKDSIKDKDAFFKEWNKMHTKFLEKINIIPKPKWKGYEKQDKSRGNLFRNGE